MLAYKPLYDDIDLGFHDQLRTNLWLLQISLCAFKINQRQRDISMQAFFKGVE